jgi:hypothetical protein
MAGYFPSAASRLYIAADRFALRCRSGPLGHPFIATKAAMGAVDPTKVSTS